MKQRLTLKDELFPVQAVFNALDEREFAIALANFAEGRGVNPENLACLFPADIAEEEFNAPEAYDYIEFWSHSGNQTVHCRFCDFAIYVERAVDAEVADTGDRALLEMVPTIKARLDQMAVASAAYRQTGSAPPQP